MPLVHVTKFVLISLLVSLASIQGGRGVWVVVSTYMPLLSFSPCYSPALVITCDERAFFVFFLTLTDIGGMSWI